MSSIATPVRKVRLGTLLRPGECFHFAKVTASALPCAMHDHDFLEVFFVRRGHGTESTPSSERTLSAGDIAFVSADDAHGLGGDATFDMVNIAFPRSAWSQLRRRYGQDLADLFDGPMERRRRRIGPAELATLEEAIRTMAWGHRDRLTLDGFMLTVDRVMRRPPTEAASAPRWLASALLDRRLVTEGLTGLYAACGGYGREYIARACRKAFDRTPTELVNDRRIAAAARLLERTDLSVLDVCFESGFHNVGHFHKRFHAAYNTTPRAYRARQRGVMPG